ncbi:MAG TPA: GreA/GreB family elongation factor, partial [Stellaceae bacterium]|nr:GreA/GreB family elongation factor [Stellaceae bacterium]
TVTLADEETDEETRYQIVGEDEADISQGRLSVTSPLARALIGKSVGDNVEVSTPRGSKSYEVVKVAFR